MGRLLVMLLLCLPANLAAAEHVIPGTEAHSLDGRVVRFPVDLQRPTVLILGFTRGSADSTTAWEKALRTNTASSGVYDIAVLASVPQFVRPFVVRSIRKQVPPIAQPNFLTVFDHEPEWKQAAGFESHTPDAAYVLLVDRQGQIIWQTHDACSPQQLAILRRAWSALL